MDEITPVEIGTTAVSIGDVSVDVVAIPVDKPVKPKIGDITIEQQPGYTSSVNEKTRRVERVLNGKTVTYYNVWNGKGWSQCEGQKENVIFHNE